MNWRIEYEICFLIAVFAFVYSYILTQPQQILNGIFKRLDLFFKTAQRADQGKPVHWLFKIILQCEKCVAGQIALWLYGFTHIDEYIESPIETPFLHLAFITMTIFLTAIIKNIYTKQIENE